MPFKAKTLVLAVSMMSLLAAPFAEAARMGKGRSSGMHRSAPTQSYQYQQPMQAPRPMAPAPRAQEPRRGVGVGTAIAAGAAGAAAGYMIGSAMNDNGHAAEKSAAPAQQQAAPAQQQAAPAQQQAAPANTEQAPAQAQTAPAQTAAQPAAEPAPKKEGNHIPWGTVAILALITAAGYFIFRRKAGVPAPRANNNAYQQPNNMQTPNNQYDMGSNNNQFGGIPKIGEGLQQQQPAGYGQAPMQNTAPVYSRLPDGTDVPSFLRQAKATFLHLQSLNSSENVDEVAKYMTPQLFMELRDDIITNTSVADFPQLNCDLIEAADENGRWVASVRFSGLVSEEVNAPAVPFTETWHYVKDAYTNNRWLVAGIQQQ